MPYQSKKLNPFKQVLLNVLIGLAIVSSWRGAWGIMKIYLIPNNKELGYWASFLIGLPILYFTKYLNRDSK